MTADRRSLVMAGLATAASASVSASVSAQAGDPLFVNATTDESHRARMAISFAKNQLDRGHPVTLFWNDRGVFVASAKRADTFAAHHEMLAQMLERGAQILVCPMCMEHYGVAENELIAGAQVGNPARTGAALFAPGSRTLTW